MTPQAYFITFPTYGTWLHGDDRGSADRDHNKPGEPYLAPDAGLNRYRAELMTAAPYRMDATDREIVLAAIRDQAEYRGWHLSAAHVRTRHVHVVVTADAAPERVMNVFKSYATRALNAAHPADHGRPRWSRHGSTRWLDSDAAAAGAVHYPLYEQGEPMAVYPVPCDSPDKPEASRAATERERPKPNVGDASEVSNEL